MKVDIFLLGVSLTGAAFGSYENACSGTFVEFASFHIVQTIHESVHMAH